MAENNSSAPLKTAELPLAVRTAPERIWLDLGVEEAEHINFAELEVTWSDDNATGHGIAYVRADTQAVAAQAAPAAVAVPETREELAKRLDSERDYLEAIKLPPHNPTLAIEDILNEYEGDDREEVWESIKAYAEGQARGAVLIERKSLAATPALPATEDSSAGDLASGSENAVKDFMALVDDWREKDFAAAEANDPFVENACAAQSRLAERLAVEADIARKAIESKLIGLLDARLLKVAAQGESSADEYPHEQMDALAIARYKVVPRNQGVHCIHAVVAGDGQQHLYNGSEVDCQNMARKFAGAFLDGAFAFHQRYTEPHAQPTDALDAETIKKAADYDHLLPYLCKTCGGYGLVDRRSNEGPMDSEPCPNCSRPPDRIDFFLDELQRDGAEMLIMALHDEEGFPLDKKRAIAALDKARVIRAAMAAAQEGGNAAKEA